MQGHFLPACRGKRAECLQNYRGTEHQYPPLARIIHDGLWRNPKPRRETGTRSPEALRRTHAQYLEGLPTGHRPVTTADRQLQQKRYE